MAVLPTVSQLRQAGTAQIEACTRTLSSFCLVSLSVEMEFTRMLLQRMLRSSMVWEMQWAIFVMMDFTFSWTGVLETVRWTLFTSLVLAVLQLSFTRLVLR